MKQTLLKACNVRGDNVAARVHVTINAAITDIHAACSQYHQDCYTTIVSKGNIAAASCTSESRNQIPLTLLSSTDKGAIEHVKRAHLQVRIWRAADHNYGL